MRNLHKDNSRDMDPREALLNIAKEAAADPQWVTPAYQQTQPKFVYNMDKSAWGDTKSRTDELK